MLEKNRIYCMDNVEGMKKLNDETVDLTVTSPPYDNLRKYNRYCFDFENVAKQLYRITKNGGVVVWVVNDATIKGSETLTSFRQALYFKELGFNVHDTMIYEVAGTGAKGSRYAYWQGFEFMFVFSKGKPSSINLIADRRNKLAGMKKWSSPKCNDLRTRTNRAVVTKEFGIRTNIWRYAAGFFSGDDKTKHPAPFPEALARDHIISWSKEGDLVLDPFMGSGTTAKEALLLKRDYIGFDISEEYCRMAEERLKVNR